MNILVLLKSAYARLIGTFGVNLNRIYGCVIHIALSKHGLPVLCDVNELCYDNIATPPLMTAVRWEILGHMIHA